MKKRQVIPLFLIAILVPISSLMIKVSAETTIGVITIDSSGVISPVGAPISHNGEVFTLTDDIFGYGSWGIEIDRSGIILDGNGSTLRGNMTGATGIKISGLGVNNVTVRNLNIKNWTNGIHIIYSSGNKVYGNNITANVVGVNLSECNDTEVFDNNITASSAYGVSLLDSSHGNNITENSITNNRLGIWFDYSAHDNNVTLNTLSNNYDGMFFGEASNNTISQNDIADTAHIGVRMNGAFNNSLSSNMLNNVTYGFDIQGSTLRHFLQSISTSNLVEGRPVYYLANQSNLQLSPATHPHVGYLALINCANVTIQGLNLTNSGEGMLLAFTEEAQIANVRAEDNAYGLMLYASSNNTISNSNITKNQDGIYLAHSSQDDIFGNTIASNTYGIGFENASSNNIYHNNFINNTNHTYDVALITPGVIARSSSKPLIGLFPVSTNTWDDGYPSGGNYWDNYNGTDSHMGGYQNETGSDGIGDSPFSVYVNNTDNYPLMGMFHSYNVTYFTPPLVPHFCTVTLISNSSVSGFEAPIWIEHPEVIFLTFNVTGAAGSTGFCRVIFPTAMMNGTYHVSINGVEIPYTLLPSSDANYSYLYFNYTHSTKTVVIIPEFPSYLILPFFMIAILLAVIVCKKKRPFLADLRFFHKS